MGCIKSIAYKEKLKITECNDTQEKLLIYIIDQKTSYDISDCFKIYYIRSLFALSM